MLNVFASRNERIQKYTFRNELMHTTYWRMQKIVDNDNLVTHKIQIE